MSRFRTLFASAGEEEKGLFTRQLVHTVNDLLGVSLDDWVPGWDTFDEVLDFLGGRLTDGIADPAYRFDPPKTWEMINALTTPNNPSPNGFLNDLAEILFLPREERAEYANHRDIAKPYVISKLLLEYALFSIRLDRLIGSLTKRFCATRCLRLPVGCCSILGYDMNLVPHKMLELQLVEAQRIHWQQPLREEKCKYHTATGCVLRLFKSPACIGYLCDDLNGHLSTAFPNDRLADFLSSLSIFRNCYLDRQNIFLAMEATHLTGERLLGNTRGSACDDVRTVP